MNDRSGNGIAKLLSTKPLLKIHRKINYSLGASICINQETKKKKRRIVDKNLTTT